MSRLLRGDEEYSFVLENLLNIARAGPVPKEIVFDNRMFVATGFVLFSPEHYTCIVRDNAIIWWSLNDLGPVAIEKLTLTTDLDRPGIPDTLIPPRPFSSDNNNNNNHHQEKIDFLYHCSRSAWAKIIGVAYVETNK